MAAVEPLPALAIAERVREGTSLPINAYDLWLAAKYESSGNGEARRTKFRHAMIHAGFLVTTKGAPYKRCPMCHAMLR